MAAEEGTCAVEKRTLAGVWEACRVESRGRLGRRGGATPKLPAPAPCRPAQTPVLPLARPAPARRLVSFPSFPPSATAPAPCRDAGSGVSCGGGGRQAESAGGAARARVRRGGSAYVRGAAGAIVAALPSLRRQFPASARRGCRPPARGTAAAARMLGAGMMAAGCGRAALCAAGLWLGSLRMGDCACAQALSRRVGCSGRCTVESPHSMPRQECAGMRTTSKIGGFRRRQRVGYAFCKFTST